jgi:hypothetical protein
VRAFFIRYLLKGEARAGYPAFALKAPPTITPTISTRIPIAIFYLGP